MIHGLQFLFRLGTNLLEDGNICSGAAKPLTKTWSVVITDTTSEVDLSDYDSNWRKLYNCFQIHVGGITNNSQWRSQPDNLVPLCKFEIIIIIHFFRNWLFSQSIITKICIAGLNRRAGYATDNSCSMSCCKLNNCNLKCLQICNNYVIIIDI